MTDSGVEGAGDYPVTAPRVPWLRRKAPAALSPFPRAVWWTGHGQLFIGFGLALLGPVLFALSFSGQFGAFDSLGYPGLLMMAMAGPFACSGLLLRRHSLRLAGSGGALWLRIVELSVVVTLIAVLSIVFVFVDMLILIIGGGWLISAIVT